MQFLHHYSRAKRNLYYQLRKWVYIRKLHVLQFVSLHLVIFSPVLCYQCTKFLQFVLLMKNA